MPPPARKVLEQHELREHHLEILFAVRSDSVGQSLRQSIKCELRKYRYFSKDPAVGTSTTALRSWAIAREKTLLEPTTILARASELRPRCNTWTAPPSASGHRSVRRGSVSLSRCDRAMQVGTLQAIPYPHSRDSAKERTVVSTTLRARSTDRARAIRSHEEDR
jgi:hypothetical protein